ncbi:MAG: NotI family restriction endonuclease [Tepidisphaeraceae bacterium]|jgi:restriction endonuclease NotI
MPAPATQRQPAPRFGIGEWYGRSFIKLSAIQRRDLAVKAINHGSDTTPLCPFKADGGACHKKGGVCSLRLYEAKASLPTGEWSATPVVGQEGDLRIVCPTRFQQNEIVFRKVALTVLGTDSAKTVGEVRFLQRVRNEPSTSAAAEQAEEETAREDVGNIDMVLLAPETDPLKWCALEIQAVYFSGERMGLLFEHLHDFPTDDLPFPDRTRRPDYRSSGPKRLMPQLQIKVPTLRRWGKKMAVVVDGAFFRNMGRMDTVKDLSNCDIAWFVVQFDEGTDPATLKIGEPEKQTLERAVEGLTGGEPVTLAEFEAKIRAKLGTGE